MIVQRFGSGMWPADRNAAFIKDTERAFWNLALSPDGKTFATAGRDSTVKIWDTEPAASLPRFPVGARVKAFRFLKDCQTLITLDDDHFISRWDSVTGLLINRIPIDLTDADGWSAFSPDGQILAIVDHDRTFSFWNTRTGTRQSTLDFKVQHATPLFSPDGRYVFVVYDASRWFLWDLERSCIAELRDRTVFAGFTGSGEATVTDAKGYIHWWNPQTGQTRSPASKPIYRPWVAAVSPDGRTLATADPRNRKIHLWHSETLGLQNELMGHEADLSALSFDLTRVKTRFRRF